MAGLQQNGFDVLDLARKASVKRGDIPLGGSTILQLFVPSTPLRTPLPPNLPPVLWHRDRILSLTPRADAQWGAAIGIAVTKVASLAWEARSSIGLRSKRAQEILLNADSALGQGGWVHYLAKQVRDYLCTNSGCVTEIVRETMAYGSRIVGINHLPSVRCRRTGVPETPIIYTDKGGREHLLEYWQVMYFSDLPDPDELLYGGGLCAAERAYPQIVKMAAIEGFIYEKVSGSRPLAVHIISGLKTDQIEDAIKGAEDQMAREGLTSYMGAVIMATINPTTAPSIVTIPLAELPNGFDAEAERNRADLIYSNAIGLDPQDLAPLATSNLGTATQSLVLHDKAKGRGLLMFRQAFTHGLNQLVMDDKTKFLFVERDYDDQLKQAQISKARADVSAVRIDKQITTPDQERQILVDQDELPRAFISEDTIPGESLSDTDKAEVDEPSEMGQGVDDEASAESEPVDPGTETAPGDASPSQPYLLTAGKSRKEASLFTKNPTPKRGAEKNVDLEDEDLLKLVSEMMSNLGTVKKAHSAVRRKGRSVRDRPRCPVCQSRVISEKSCHSCGYHLGRPEKASIDFFTRRCQACGEMNRVTLKACYHCGHNFHAGQGGGGGGSATHTSTGQKLTPKLAKEMLANPSGHSAEDLKSAAQHLHDKGYIGHSAFQKEVTKINQVKGSSGGAQPAPTAPKPGGAATKILNDDAALSNAKIYAADLLKTNGQISDDEYDAAVKKIVQNGPSYGVIGSSKEAQLFLNHPDSTSAQKKLAADFLLQKGEMTPTEHKMVLAVHGAGPSTSVPTNKPSGSQFKFSDDSHALNSMNAVGTSSDYKKQAAEHLLTSSTSTVSQKLAANNHLLQSGHLTQSDWESNDLKIKLGQPPSLGGGSSGGKSLFTDSDHAYASLSPSNSDALKTAAAKHIMGDPNSTPSQQKTALNHLYDSGEISQTEYNEKYPKVVQGQSVTGGGGPSGSSPVNIQSSSHASTILASPGSSAQDKLVAAQHLAKDPSAPLSDKVAAANHLFEEGKISHEQFMDSISNTGKAPDVWKYSSSNEASMALQDTYKQPGTKIAAANYLYNKGKITKEEYDLEVNKILGKTSPSTSSSPPPVPSSKPFIPVTKPSIAKGVLASSTATPEEKLQAADLLLEKGYMSKKTHALETATIKAQAAQQGVSPTHVQNSAVNAAQAKINAAHNPTPQAQQQAQTAQAQAAKTVSISVAHDPAPHADGAKEFLGPSSGGAADKWGREHFTSWSNSLPSDERAAVVKYTGNWYDEVNGELRGGNLSSYNKTTVAALDRALNKAVVPEDFMAHRGLSYGKLEKMMNDGSLPVGAVFHDKGYGSSSPSSAKGWNKPIRVRIRVPKGSNGAYVDQISAHPGETEFLFPRNASFKVKGYTKASTPGGGSVWILDVDYMGHGEVVI